ncbi:MAG: phosphate signaling complex protein PhoU [Chloroflexota bacterium]|nr:phosphate signaling complex protein PhoU [Chloroflexota bacterium]
MIVAQPNVPLPDELDALKDDVLRLGARVENALGGAHRALAERDVDLADAIRWDDEGTNELQRRINATIAAMLGQRPRDSGEVRELLTLYHAASELERMGDYAVNIAKLAQQLAGEPELRPFPQIAEMDRLCREQLHAAMRALVDVSEQQARQTCARDDEIDRLYSQVYRDALDLMIRDPSRATQATHLLFVAHHLERLGDRVTNIGEDVVYLATGRVEDLNP